MRLSKKSQELLERIWVAMEDEGETGLTTRNLLPDQIEELVQLGLARLQEDRLTLAAVGLREAARSLRRHRLAERLLSDVLKTDEELIKEHACRLQYALFDGLDDSICTLLGHPRFCPHGKPIPQGECCRQMRELVGRLIAPLCELQPGQQGDIAYIQMNNPSSLQKLMAMGVLPGVTVELLRRFPAFVFRAGNSQFAVDEKIAVDIYVRLLRPSVLPAPERKR